MPFIQKLNAENLTGHMYSCSRLHSPDTTVASRRNSSTLNATIANLFVQGVITEQGISLMSGICRVAPCRIQCVDRITWVLLGFTMGSTVLILTFASGVDTIVHFVGEDIF